MRGITTLSILGLQLAALLFLSACAGTGATRFAAPADFPLHTTDHPFFDVHWRLDRTARTAQASGLVEATRQGNVADVTLELQGVDASGRVVSRALGTTYGGPLYRGDLRPFTVHLLPTGREDHFTLEVWAYTWEHGTDGRAAR